MKECFSCTYVLAVLKHLGILSQLLGCPWARMDQQNQILRFQKWYEPHHRGAQDYPSTIFVHSHRKWMPSNCFKQGWKWLCRHGLLLQTQQTINPGSPWKTKFLSGLQLHAILSLCHLRIYFTPSSFFPAPAFLLSLWLSRLIWLQREAWWFIHCWHTQRMERRIMNDDCGLFFLTKWRITQRNRLPADSVTDQQWPLK